MRRWEVEKMGRWEDEKMGRWDDEKKRRWGDKKMRRWEDCFKLDFLYFIGRAEPKSGFIQEGNLIGGGIKNNMLGMFTKGCM